MVNQANEGKIQSDTKHIWELLKNIPDPEMPYISIVDLGIIREISWEYDSLRVVVTPTYSGCPAKKSIEEDICRILTDHGVVSVILESRLYPPWTTDWISKEGREKLLIEGVSPPLPVDTGWQTLKFLPIEKSKVISCPQCGSNQTQLQSEFGGTACKSLYMCESCLNPFEYFKSL
ncbi:phenylacetate-CoA oxygenase subunit PaaJ [Xenorhabdus nematophila]|uniref:1,2-phenylacetyl-CoA epoxidase subunit PaaD n=1 Tax=Xenorhabdus nematophila TaxID=628 RepID=UPI0003275D6B|nr:1,2-phenylacetyl-CoA epoxidase subunit PaaD [Xenorhabdus nematophila]CEF29458.1 putative multicomponent oxygenase/reductase subunit for phenylacetic acid degradation [Xenorhabdus nematophila str. Websteri]KHD27593.1 phenylacetate-CoA oxygenase [Xenorhabdus nematophila]MBA0018821.1 phenylacetate-CoA oxygenase subunit PaaJ [Xenorhabdus nematophila]MCB4426530.1 phenylacetate-CoA oxygenase subunit PaaJ [Xenorhabdus nematophila]CCW28990.1 Phenylacetic acid degradation protein paaD [Xenorhabdus n